MQILQKLRNLGIISFFITLTLQTGQVHDNLQKPRPVPGSLSTQQPLAIGQWLVLVSKHEEVRSASGMIIPISHGSVGLETENPGLMILKHVTPTWCTSTLRAKSLSVPHVSVPLTLKKGGCCSVGGESCPVIEGLLVGILALWAEH